MSTLGQAYLGASLSLLIAGALGACGSGGDHGVVFGQDAGGGDSGGTLADSGSLRPDTGNLNGNNTVQSIVVAPASATLPCVSGATATQPFTATATYKDGSHAVVTGKATWSADSPQVGKQAGPVFTASGALGGTVHVSAVLDGVTGSATLNVALSVTQNPASVPTSVQTALKGATAKDASVVWAYPYDGTVWPRGLLPPILQWNGGAATDDYYVHLKSPTFDLQLFTTATGAPASQLPLDAGIWEQVTDSSAGTVHLTVARWDGTTASVLVNQDWTIASGSMRGTIYYWSNDLGRVLRIAPGAAMADDFANQPPINDPAQFQQNSAADGTGGCLMTCHTVSADGSTLVSGGGVYAGSYNLLTDMPMHSLGGTWFVDPNAAGQPVWNNIQWNVPALSPTGKYILTNSMAQSGVTVYNGPDTIMGLFTTADGLPVANSGVTGTPFAAPAWSPDGARVAFVDSGDPTTWAGFNWQNPPPGDLKAIEFDETKSPMFSGEKTLVSVGTKPAITWPTVSPDGKWVVYARAGSFDTRNGNGDLYMASAVTPNQEVRLAVLDGDGYPFAAGSRDLSWNYEPSFAPVAAGGYFWVVFTSRRTYGNTLTGQALPCTTSPCSEVKQLWVAAIDQSPQPGVDPSHAPFHLTGQVESNLAMRGFWSLPPCKGDGMGCATGTDCCGGFCTAGVDGGGGGVCKSTSAGCAADGNRCNASSDCCDAPSGVTCINHVCSEPPPR